MFSVAPDGGTIADGLKPMKAVPTMIIGVKSDILFPVSRCLRFSASILVQLATDCKRSSDL